LHGGSSAEFAAGSVDRVPAGPGGLIWTADPIGPRRIAPAGVDA